MKFMRKGLAMLLAALLIMPTGSVSAAEPSALGDDARQMVEEASSVTAGDPENQAEGTTEGNSIGEDSESTKNDGIVGDDETIEDDTIVDENKIIDDKEIADAPTADDGDEIADDNETDGLGEVTASVETTDSSEVLFNTGNHAFSVVDRESFDQGNGDAFFEEDGSYTINIPEENPFFPYEVQFTYEGKVTNQWFMTPDDSVEVGGHTFHVSAYFDDTVVTQMSFEVGGDTVVVYPEEKVFTNDGDGVAPASLLPLEERSLTVDLRDYTPVELTMVSLSTIFTGMTLGDTDSVVWTYTYDDNYVVSTSGAKIDVSYATYNASSKSLQMIVSEPNQLNDNNIRYIVTLNVTPSENWLVPVVYTQDNAGNRKKINVSRNSYHDYEKDKYMLEVYIPSAEIGDASTVYVGLDINSALYANPIYDHYKIVYAEWGGDITDLFCPSDMTTAGAGYPCIIEDEGFGGNGTMVHLKMITYDAADNVTGELPLWLTICPVGNYFSDTLIEKTESGGWNYVSIKKFSRAYVDGCYYMTNTLYKEYAANDTYYLKMDYYWAGVKKTSDVTGAYVGQYSSIAEAVSAGAPNIKDKLFSDNYSTGGYGADYSKGVFFTIFVGPDDAEDQRVHKCCYRVEAGTDFKPALGSGTDVSFEGLVDGAGNEIPSYSVANDEDSYGEKNYLTILVGKDIDLTNVAPKFELSDRAKLYAEGSSSEEISGVSRHDFSKGSVQYTVSAGNGRDSRNYWLQIVKASDDPQLYINSLADKDANTTTDANGVIHSTREVMLDGYHNYWHDIFLANMGPDEIPALSVELASNVVELDEYWMLDGKYGLAGFSTLEKTSGAYHGELPNLAKVRIRAKEGITAKEVSGTLTIKSGNTSLAVLTLTGVIGDPSITTETIPTAVKYVPYGTMIQNNNKYSWNRLNYRLLTGALPAGMVVRPNGEIYGVPKEAGEFSFTVCMDNSSTGFMSSTKTYTLVVEDNTDANVESATDPGYYLTERVKDLYLDSMPITGDQLMVSQGIYGEFVDIYLDGVRLVEGTDYTSESGSTRITILNQTLALSGAASVGTHTLGIEFRTQDKDILQRAAQNYVIHVGKEPEQGGNAGNGSSGDKGSESSWKAGTVFVADTDSETVEHIVASGESLWKIAAKYYGSGTYWKKIYADNAGTISDPNKIYVGQKLIIHLSGRNDEGGLSLDGTTYAVTSGDTLWKIAQKVYGKGRYWRKIYDANVDIIEDPSRIYVGQVFLIPED